MTTADGDLAPLQPIPLITVTRVHSADGKSSHIEPPCDDEEDARWQLAWKASCVRLAADIPIELYWDAEHHTFTINVGRASAAPFTFADAWTYLNGVEAGARAEHGSG